MNFYKYIFIHLIKLTDSWVMLQPSWHDFADPANMLLINVKNKILML